MPIIDENKCIICNSSNVEVFPAKFSDFVAKRVFGGSNKTFKFVHCQECGFCFYNYRFSPDEIEKLYNNYRDVVYQKQRQSCENWYSSEINNLLGKGKKEILSRSKNLTKIIQDNIFARGERIESVLDYGGDRGQFIPEIISNAEKYVYEISGVEALPGIISISSLEQVGNKKFDFVMCCHVLEHVVAPDKIIKEIKDLISDDGFLYVELPFDYPFNRSMISNIQYLFNPYFRLKDLIIQYIKNKKNTGTYFLHEHINYYMPDSINRLLTNNGFDVLYSNIYKISSVIGRCNVISVLAKLQKTELC